MYSIGSIRGEGFVDMVYFVHYQSVNVIHCGCNEANTAMAEGGLTSKYRIAAFTRPGRSHRSVCFEGFALQIEETGSPTAGSPSP